MKKSYILFFFVLIGEITYSQCSFYIYRTGYDQISRPNKMDCSPTTRNGNGEIYCGGERAGSYRVEYNGDITVEEFNTYHFDLDRGKVIAKGILRGGVIYRKEGNTEKEIGRISNGVLYRSGSNEAIAKIECDGECSIGCKAILALHCL